MRGYNVIRSDFIDRATAKQLIKRLQPANACICDIALATGLRLDDVCRLTTAQLRHAQSHSGWLSVTEQKTGKRRRVRLSRQLMQRMDWLCYGGTYVFEGQRDSTKHRTRQRVWRDLTGVAAEAGLADHISPHSLRKLYAVEQYRKHKDLRRVQRQLNHDNITTTLLYAMSDQVTAAAKGKQSGRKAG